MLDCRKITLCLSNQKEKEYVLTTLNKITGQRGNFTFLVLPPGFSLLSKSL